MKFLALMAFFLILNDVHAKSIAKKPNRHFKNSSKSKIVYCKEKEIPIKALGEYHSGLLKIYISTDSDVKNLTINSARGINKVIIGKTQEVRNVDLNPSEEIETSIEIESLEGQGFIVLDISFQTKNKNFSNSLVIPVGELSLEQLKARKKDIKSIPTKRTSTSKQNPNALSTDNDTETLHVMQLEN